MTEQSKKPKQLKSDTRQWNSGRVHFAVIGWPGKPNDNYIVFEKNFFGKTKNPNQKFNLKFTDWNNLKKLVDGELTSVTEWEKTVAVVDDNSLAELIKNDPDIFSKVLSNPNILKLSDSSFESLDRIAVKIYEIKTDKIDLILKKLAETNSTDLENFSTLLNDLRINQVSMMTTLVYQKLKIIDLLENVILSKESREKDVHQIFEKHPWLLGRAFEIVSSDRALTEYLNTNLEDDPETRVRPDIIARTIPHTDDIVIIELKRPGIKLKAKHIGQVLEYKALVQRIKPNIKNINCFVFGYEKDNTFTSSKDAEIRTFAELVSELRHEYKVYQDVLEVGQDLDFEFKSK